MLDGERENNPIGLIKRDETPGVLLRASVSLNDNCCPLSRLILVARDIKRVLVAPGQGVDCEIFLTMKDGG